MNTQDIPPVIAHSIHFSLSHLDVLRCRLWVLAHNKIIVALLLLMSVGVAVSTLRPSEVKGFSTAYTVFYIVLMTGVMLCIMGVFQIAFQILWLVLNKNRGVLGPHELEIREDGLLERTPIHESLHRWSGFHKVTSSRSYLFIFVTDNIVHYVPMRCFSTNEDAKKFQDEIQRRWKAA